MASPAFSVAGLFAGIGGLELGLARAGGQAELLCESWEPARAVLSAHWLKTNQHDDVRTLRSLPKVDVVTAGFPCQDLSQAGSKKGISGIQSGLVGEVFRLLKQAGPTWLVLENVKNMLVLNKGWAMRHLIDELEGLGYRWAYRLVDSRSRGLPQRRQRVLFVASKTEDPASILLTDEAGEPCPEDWYTQDAYGFYWTEGRGGLGWARDAVPTLKGGSTVGIPSAPAVWVRDAPVGRQVVTPSMEDAEALQGFPRGWTRPAQPDGRRNGPRWKLIGNAVTVDVAEWLGNRLACPGEPITDGQPHNGGRWPAAAWGGNGKVWASPLSMWPQALPYTHLLDLLDLQVAVPLSRRATAGFFSRTERSTLRFDPEFLVAVKEHLRYQTVRQSET